jgi:hypothetical protein
VRSIPRVLQMAGVIARVIPAAHVRIAERSSLPKPQILAQKIVHAATESAELTTVRIRQPVVRIATVEMGAASRDALIGIGLGTTAFHRTEGMESSLLSTITAMKTQLHVLEIATVVTEFATKAGASFRMDIEMAFEYTQTVDRIAFVEMASARQLKIG